MANVIKDTFKNTYKDDYSDSAGYHKILFNNARSIQQRELNQMQSIITNDLLTGYGGIGYKNGLSAVGGGVTTNNKVNFIKLDTTSGNTIDALTNPTTDLLGIVFKETGTNVLVRVDNYSIVSGLEKATLYVSYIDSGSATGTTEGLTITDGTVLTSETTVNGETVTLTSFSGGGTADPTTGQTTLATVKTGKFYIDGHFVHADEQNLVLSKYTSTFSGTVGFVVNETIVTSTEDNNLFDNSGATLNTASPGADRYKITLTFIDKALVDSGEYFVPLAKISNGQVSEETGASSGTSPLGQGIANLVKSAEGDFTVGKMLVDVTTNVDSDTRVDFGINPGSGYVDGEYFKFISNSTVTHKKPRSTLTATNATIATSYGNYVIATNYNSKTITDKISTFDTITFKTAVTWGGTSIGTARIRSIEPYGNKWKIYLFDVKLIAGQNFGATKSMGVSTTDFFNVQQDNGVAELKDIQNNNLFFPLPYDRPASLTDITMTTQRIVAATTDGDGNVTLAQSLIGGSGNTYTDTSSWVCNIDSDGTIRSPTYGTPGSTTTVALGADGGGTAIALAVLAQKTATIASKTLTTVTASSIAPSTIDGKANSVSLGHADIYEVTSVLDVNANDNVITDRYIIDKGQRDNFYDVGKLILKGGATAPGGNVKVTFKYFAHGTGDFFAKGSYDGQVTYENIPSHRLANGDTLQLRDHLDFRSRKANAADNFTGTGKNVLALPKAHTLITADESYYLGRAGIVYIHKLGYAGVDLGFPSRNPQLPATTQGKEYLKIATFQINPYMLDDEDMSITYYDNRGYRMKDVANLERRVDELEEVVAMNALELATTAYDILDSSGVNRLKSGITTDNFQNHAFSDVNLPGYKASINPAKNELRPEFVARPIELVYTHDSSANTVLVGDKVMLSYTHTLWKDQSVASRDVAVNPFAVERMIGNIEMSPASDNWHDTVTLAPKIIKGDLLMDTSATKSFGNWNFNWSGVNIEDLSDHKAGDQVGQKDHSGTYSTSTTSANGAVTTNTYQKNVTQSHYISSISSVKTATGAFEINQVSKPFMRSRYVSFKATGLRPNTQYFGFLDGRSVDDWIDCDPGTGSFVRMATLARGNQYLATGNAHYTATAIPSGATASKMTDAHGALSGYLLIPNTASIQFLSGARTFTLQDTSKFVRTGQDKTYTSIATFVFESTGLITEIENEYRETRTIQMASAVTELSNVLLSSILTSPYSGGREGEAPDKDNDGIPDHLDYPTVTNDGNAIDKTSTISVQFPNYSLGNVYAGWSPTSVNVAINNSSDLDAFGGAGGDPGGSGDGGGASRGCFVAGTMIEMADGSEKEITLIDIGEETKGGTVHAKMKFSPENIYDYKGVGVSGSHYVLEDGQFVSVEDSKHGKLTDKKEVVYTFITSDYRIFIKGIEFGAYYTQDPSAYADWKGGIEKLNAELKYRIN